MITIRKVSHPISPTPFVLTCPAGGEENGNLAERMAWQQDEIARSAGCYNLSAEDLRKYSSFKLHERIPNRAEATVRFCDEIFPSIELPIENGEPVMKFAMQQVTPFIWYTITE